MRWIRLIGGWLLVAVGGSALVSLGVTSISELLHPRPNGIPWYGVLFLGTISGVCPIFLGWTLLRRTVQPRAAQAGPAAPGPDQPPVEDTGTLVIEVDMRQEDLTRAHFWMLRKNYFIRFFYAGFLVSVVVFASWPGAIDWNAAPSVWWKPILYLGVVFSFPVMSWSNARIAFQVAHAGGRLKILYECSRAGLRVASAESDVRSPWSTVAAVWETADSFFLFQQRMPIILLPSWRSVPIIIPKRCCAAPADVGRLRVMIAQALGTRARMRTA